MEGTPWCTYSRVNMGCLDILFPFNGLELKTILNDTGVARLRLSINMDQLCGMCNKIISQGVLD